MSNFASLNLIFFMVSIIHISEATLAQLKATGRRQKGSIGLDRTSDGQEVLTFREYRQSETPKRNPQRLLTLPNGWLKKSARRYQFHLSLKDELGECRAADELERDSQEAKQFLRHLSDVLNFT